MVTTITDKSNLAVFHFSKKIILLHKEIQNAGSSFKNCLQINNRMSVCRTLTNFCMRSLKFEGTF